VLNAVFHSSPSDAYNVVGIPEVEFGEHLGTIERGKSRTDEWQGIIILYCDVIQPTEVYARPQSPILYIYKENQHPPEMKA
jgi:hypothetical protein